MLEAILTNNFTNHSPNLVTIIIIVLSCLDINLCQFRNKKHDNLCRLSTIVKKVRVTHDTILVHLIMVWLDPSLKILL
jgi:hypothetical protein